MDPLEDEHAPLFTVGQVAEMLAVKQAFLRRVDEIRVIRQVVTMTDEGMTLPAIRRIIDLEQQLADAIGRLAEVTRHRDELARRLADAHRGLQQSPDDPPRPT